MDKRLQINGLVNFQMVAATGQNDDNKDLFSRSVQTFSKLNIPVFRPIISHRQTREEWEKNYAGLANEISWAYSNTEMTGMIEPILIACREDGMDMMNVKPIEERVEKFTRRSKKWLNIGQKSNHEKKVVLMLHCAPCAGVEATLGLGAGLDVFKSVVNVLNALKDQGYEVEDIPQTGLALKEYIIEKKAYQDFRWTTVDSIVEAGGVLCAMPISGKDGYMQYYDKLDAWLQHEMENTWGIPPGEGMVYEDEIIISGLQFGNIYIMIQPKRGCYGPKCTGEVCKILHDPSCPPPHQYLATYRFIENIIEADAVVHFGTGGSLEHLPGKTNGLSELCWPDVVLGDNLNLYVYNAGIGVEGVGAKRRNYAVINDYIPGCMNIDTNSVKLVKSIGQYLEAVESGSRQVEFLKNRILAETENVKKAKEIIEKEEDFISGVISLKNILVQTINNSYDQSLHNLGEIPDVQERIAYIKESLDGSSLVAKEIKNVIQEEYKYNEWMIYRIYNILDEESEKIQFNDFVIPEKQLNELDEEIKLTDYNIQKTENEIAGLIRGLNGEYIEPGLSGMPMENMNKIMPTGRNMFIMDTQKVPSKEAYYVGEMLAEDLIALHKKESGEIPKKISMNMISTDISMTQGEQLSQVLNLLGVRPVWNESGIVMEIEAIPIEELKRPRIDVIVRISGVLRDSYPDMVEMMDEAVKMVIDLDESIEDNYVKRNTIEIEKMLAENNEICDTKKRASIRIFGDKPGTYSSGVELALKASSWNTDRDIAKIFTDASGYAYGKDLNGDVCKHEFVANVKDTDISYDTTISSRYHLMSSGFSASVLGGFNALKKEFSDEELKQYHGTSKNKEEVIVSELSKELERIMGNTFFNPIWKEGIKEKEYTGASELMRNIQTVFDWQCLSENIEHQKIDLMVDTYLGDEEMVEWLKDNNRFALEEISRRFLELNERKKWIPSPETLDTLQKVYMTIEGDMEEEMENCKGEYQGGNIEVLTYDDIEAWKKKMNETEEIFNVVQKN
jgi:cobaltochelatase CobN